jgi:hypothetical protein
LSHAKLLQEAWHEATVVSAAAGCALVSEEVLTPNTMVPPAAALTAKVHVLLDVT